MSRAKIALAALLLAFASMAALRLNGFCLLEPDSPGYLFGARSLASFDGYRDIDRPQRPLHTFRPPGLPVLLVPLAPVAPYSVIGAKLIVLAFAMAALALSARLAARDATDWGALSAVLFIAASPYALLHATEVVTEFPYLAVSLAAILLVTRSGDRPSRAEVAALAALLTFLPFLRTIGIALVAAVALWCGRDRARRAWLPAPAIAIAATALWMLRNHAAGGPTYFGAIAADLKRLGAAAFASKSLGAAAFYAGRFLDVLLPGVWPGRPLYERMIVGGAPDLAGLHGAAWAVALAALGLAFWGMRARWTRDGALIALYAALFVGVLAVYPPRHERLTWPLVPLVWALVPAGAAAARRALSARRSLLRPAGAAALLTGAALVLWQTTASLAMVRDNRAWARDGNGFYAGRIPPLYFADWRAAGSWLHGNAPPGARVLTRHSDVGFTSGLTQDAARFEELPPQAWRARIAKLGARYLVVPTSLFGKFFPFELMDSDPAYTYAIRWRGADVAVIEIAPNRTGRVDAPAKPPAELIAACDDASAREPERVDLATRCAELVAAGGRRDEAIARLAAAVARGGADVRIQIALGQLLLGAHRNAEAQAAFRAAAELPEAELLQQTIERGRRNADAPAAPPSLDAITRAREAADNLQWDEAIDAVDEALTAAPGDLPVILAAADVTARAGQYDRALGLYGRAAAGGDAGASAKLAALRSALAIDASPAAADPAAIVSAARLWAGIGAPGRALELLEAAAARHPNDATIASRLTEVRRFYGLD